MRTVLFAYRICIEMLGQHDSHVSLSAAQCLSCISRSLTPQARRYIDFIYQPIIEPDGAMVEAIIRVASVMGIRTVAEYVENDAIKAFLTKIGVDDGQGYGIHKPEPIQFLQLQTG